MSVIIPASNEAGWIGPCLSALFASDPVPGGAEAIVVANGCQDDTADRARAMRARAETAGWRLHVVELAEGSKPLALNSGDAEARGEMRAYLDADVRVSRPLMAQLALALQPRFALYASGRPVVPRAASWATRAYARFWTRLPFYLTKAPGFGLFAVNAAGRARWGSFPGIISDDTFVRLQFEPGERLECPASYEWPMVEGFAALVRVRRRQDRGVSEIAVLHPALMEREAKPRLGRRLLVLAARQPVGFAVYIAVALAVRFGRGRAGWVRGR